MSAAPDTPTRDEPKVRLPRSPLYWAKAAYRYLRGQLAVDFAEENKEEATVAAHTLYLLGRWSPRITNTSLLLLACALAVLFSLVGDLQLGDLASLYTFSAILQGFAALLAITGTFVIFRLQSLDREIERQEEALSRLIEEIQNLGRDDPVVGVAQYSAEQVIRMLDALEARGEPEDSGRFDKDAMIRRMKTAVLGMSADGLRQRALIILLGPSTEKVRFRGLFIKPLLLLTLTIVSALTALPFSQNLHDHPAAERGLVAFVSLLALWATVATARFVWTAVQARKPEGPEALNELFRERTEGDKAVAGATEQIDVSDDEPETRPSDPEGS